MKIELLYPEVCNLFGDLMNVEYLTRCVDAEVIRTSLKETPRFVSEEVDLLYMGSVTERGQELARDAFAPYLEALKKRTAQGGVTLITGNALEIFGEYITDDDGNRIPMLGLFPTHAERHLMHRFNGMFLGKFEDLTIVGFKSQFGHSYGKVERGLFEVTRGAGLSPGEKQEGIRVNNLMATYLIGPLLVTNPPFTKYLLKLLGQGDVKLAFEEAALDAYNDRVRDFSDPKRGFEY